MYVTLHGRRRIGQRVGAGKSRHKTNRKAALALENGYKRSQLTGSLRYFVDGLYAAHHNGDNIRVYSGHVWIFEGDYLITVIGIPGKIQKNIHRYITKERKYNGEYLDVCQEK